MIKPEFFESIGLNEGQIEKVQKAINAEYDTLETLLDCNIYAKTALLILKTLDTSALDTNKELLKLKFEEEYKDFIPRRMQSGIEKK